MKERRKKKAGANEGLRRLKREGDSKEEADASLKKAKGRCAIPVHEPHSLEFFRAFEVGAAGYSSGERRRAAGGLLGAGACTEGCRLGPTMGLGTIKNERLSFEFL